MAKHKQNLNIINEPMNGFSQDIKDVKQYFDEIQKEKIELQNQIEKYKTLFNETKDAVCIFLLPTENGPVKFAEVNKSFCKLTGYSLDEAKNNLNWELLVPDNKTIITDIKKKLLNEQSYSIECKLQTKKGALIPVEITSKRWEQDSQPTILSTIHDISQKKESEHELNKSQLEFQKRIEVQTKEISKNSDECKKEIEENKQFKNELENERKRFFSVLDQMPAYIYIKAPDFSIRFANKYFEEQFGKIKNRLCYEILHGRSEPCESCPTLRVFQTKESESFERQATDGKIYQVYDYPFFDIDGSMLVMQLGINITERKQAIGALQSSEKKYKTLVDSMDDIIFTLDKKQQYVDVFGKWLSRQNISTDSYIGKKQRDILSKKTASIHEKNNKRVLKGESVIYEWEENDTSDLHYYQTSLSPLYSSSDDIDGIVGVTREITKQKLLEQQAIQSEKLMALGQMSAMVSHEFRNSLTSLKMILELQIESKNLVPSERKSLNVALSSISHMETIVSQMLSFSRPRKMEQLQTNLNELIEDSLAFLDIHLVKAKIKIEKVLDKTLPELELDKQHFKEAIINLLLNAIQSFGEKQARKITIITKKQKLREALRDKIISTIEKNGSKKEEIVSDLILNFGIECFLIIIRDTGQGIKPENQHKIFDPFFTTKTSGTGLGMVLVKRIINTHGGIITFNSQVDKGTMFKIFLPIR